MVKMAYDYFTIYQAVYNIPDSQHIHLFLVFNVESVLLSFINTLLLHRIYAIEDNILP